MSRKLLIVILFVLHGISCKEHESDKKDLSQYLNDTRKITRAGKYKEALDRFIWFDDHAAEHKQSLNAVRLSFALLYWKELADVYPPAMSELKRRRDTKTNLIMTGHGSKDLFADVQALNRTLGDTSKTVCLFKHITETQQNLAYECWPTAKETLFAAKEFKILHQYIQDPIDEFFIIKDEYLDNLRYARKIQDSELKKLFNEQFAERCVLLIQFCLATFDKQTALEIQREALKTLNDYRLRFSI